MTTTTTSVALVLAEPVSSDRERLASTGFLADYCGMTRKAYNLDMRQFTASCLTATKSAPCRLPPGSATQPSMP